MPKGDTPKEYLRAKRSGTLEGKTYSQFRDSQKKSDSALVRPGDRFAGLVARKARVIKVEEADNYLGYKEYTVQLYTLKRSDGKIAHGQQFIDYRGDRQGVTTYEPVKVGQEVVAWWPDQRQKIYNASLPNQKKKK